MPLFPVFINTLPVGQKRLEEERRLKKKQKKKEREERLKKEGKFLTEKQKQERMRLHQMLNNIKEQGQRQMLLTSLLSMCRYNFTFSSFPY